MKTPSDPLVQRRLDPFFKVLTSANGDLGMGIILDCIYLDVLRHFLTHNSYTVYILFTEHAASRSLGLVT